MIAAGNRGLTIALAGIALLLASTLIAYRSPVPLGTGAPLSLFSAYRAKAILQSLVGNGVPHPIGSPAAAEVRENIVKRLSALAAPELRPICLRRPRACGNAVSVIATLGPGSEDLGRPIGGDTTSAGGPGASVTGPASRWCWRSRAFSCARRRPHPIVCCSPPKATGLLGALLFVTSISGQKVRAASIWHAAHRDPA